MKCLIRLSLIAAAVAISGCASQHTARTTSVMVTPPTHPLNELRGVAVEARDELRLLAKIMDAKNAPTLTKDQHAQKSFQASHVPKGFERNVKFAYTGNASRAAEAIAKIAGYQFKTLGEKTPNEPWVTINVDNMPLNEALKELGVQTGSSMRVEIHDQMMVLVYKK